MIFPRFNREKPPEPSAPMPPPTLISKVTEHFFTRRQLATPITILDDAGEESITVFSVPRYPSDARQRFKAERPAEYAAFVRKQAAALHRSDECVTPKNPIISPHSAENGQERVHQRSQKSQCQTQKTQYQTQSGTRILASEPGKEPRNLDHQAPITDNDEPASAPACTTPAPECGDHAKTVPAQS